MSTHSEARHRHGVKNARLALTRSAYAGQATAKVDTADLRETFLELDASHRIIRDISLRLQALERDMLANIPLSAADQDWDPNDQFGACARDRARRVQEARSDVNAIIAGIEVPLVAHLRRRSQGDTQ